jgi:hypothetical protein
MELANQQPKEEKALTLDELQDRSLDIKNEIQKLKEGDTKITAQRILGKLNDLLDAFTPEKMDAMPGKNLMSAIKESIESINILIGKQDNSNNVTVILTNYGDKKIDNIIEGTIIK